MILSVGFSANPGFSFNKLIVGLVNWTGVFFVACYFFSKPGAATRFAYILWAAVVFWIIIGAWEWWNSQVPWANHIPSFLKIEDESVLRVLSGSARSATGMYRVQAKYNTSLSFAEFLSLATPFVLYIAMYARKWWIVIPAALTLPLVFWTIINTDSRLGAVGFLMSFMLMAFVWGVQNWLRDRESIFGPAVTLAYPVLFAAFIAATLFVGRLRNMVWGDGQHQCE